MNFAAIDWRKRVILIITTFCCYGGLTVPSIAEETERQVNIKRRSEIIPSFQDEIISGYNILPTDYRQNSKLSPEESSCQKIDTIYKDIYNFETENYYISICQQGNNFYYHRQSKLDPTKVILIPARVAFGGNVFQATSGKTVYFVGKEGDRYYSSVMLNSNEIVLEPALLPTPTSFTPDIIDRGLSFSFDDVKLNNLDQTINASWHLKFSADRRNKHNSLTCIQDSSVLNPNLDRWQNLIGKSTKVANDYAVNNGHSFIYDRVSPYKALIETKEGKIINLNIASDKIIEQVCVRRTDNI